MKYSGAQAAPDEVWDLQELGAEPKVQSPPQVQVRNASRSSAQVQGFDERRMRGRQEPLFSEVVAE